VISHSIADLTKSDLLS